MGKALRWRVGDLCLHWTRSLQPIKTLPEIRVEQLQNHQFLIHTYSRYLDLGLHAFQLTLSVSLFLFPRHVPSCKSSIVLLVNFNTVIASNLPIPSTMYRTIVFRRPNPISRAHATISFLKIMQKQSLTTFTPKTDSEG